MKFVSKILIGLFIIVGIAVLTHPTNPAEAGWGDYYVYVIKVGVQGNYFNVWMEPAESGTGWSQRRKYFDEATKKEQLAVALTALSTGKPVQATFNDDVDGGKVTQFYMLDQLPTP